MTTDSKTTPQNTHEQRPHLVVAVSLVIAIIVALIVPTSVALFAMMLMFEGLFRYWDIDLPHLTKVLRTLYSVAVAHQYLCLLLIALFVPLALWFLPKLSTRILIILFVVSLVIALIGTTVTLYALTLPFAGVMWGFSWTPYRHFATLHSGFCLV